MIPADTAGGGVEIGIFGRGYANAEQGMCQKILHGAKDQFYARLVGVDKSAGQPTVDDGYKWHAEIIKQSRSDSDKEKQTDEFSAVQGIPIQIVSAADQEKQGSADPRRSCRR